MDENRKPIEMRLKSAERIRRQTSYREKKGESKDRKSIYITRTIRGIRRTKNMYWVYETAWSTMRKGFLVIDISRNSACSDFARHVSEDYAYMLRNLAGIRRTK